jgi:hypothetical protein
MALVPETRWVDLGQGKGSEGRDAPISATARSTRPNEPHHMTRSSRKKVDRGNAAAAQEAVARRRRPRWNINGPSASRFGEGDGPPQSRPVEFVPVHLPSPMPALFLERTPPTPSAHSAFRAPAANGASTKSLPAAATACYSCWIDPLGSNSIRSVCDSFFAGHQAGTATVREG